MLSSLYKKIVNSFGGEDRHIPRLSIEISEVEQKFSEILKQKGSIAIALIAWESMSLLSSQSQEGFDIETASKGMASVLQLEVSTIAHLEPKMSLEEVSILTSTQVHILYMFKEYPVFCLYFVVDLAQSNLVLSQDLISKLSEELSQMHRYSLEKQGK